MRYISRLSILFTLNICLALVLLGALPHVRAQSPAMPLLLYVTRTDAGRKMYTLDPNTNTSTLLAEVTDDSDMGWAPDGRWLMMNATVFDSTNGTLTAAVQGLWSADSRYLVPVQGSLEVDDSIVVWDVVQGAQVFTLAVPDLEMMMGVQGNTIKPVLNYCGIG
jgi:hypothetical protein